MSLLDKLTGGNLRSIGRSDEVVEVILETPQLFGEVIDGIFSDDSIVRMRSADAAEKA